MRKVLELQFSCEEVATSKFIPIICFPFLFWTLYKQGVWLSNFTLRNLCTLDEPIKRFNPKSKEKLCTVLNYQPPQPIYLPS